MSETRALLARHGLRAKKAMGQNFLVDPSVRNRIVAAAQLSRDDTAVEIGPGLGALTGLLTEAAGRVIAVERDPDMVRVLSDELAGRDGLQIVAGDALTFDFAAAARTSGRALVVVGNLPYQITSPLLFKIIGDADRGRVVARAVLMVQREVATRIAAAPASEDYGRLSVMVQQAAEVKLLFHVGAGAFHPQPTVTSTVFSLAPRSVPLAPVRDDAMFASVVRAAFGARRKMLRRALGGVFGDGVTTAALLEAGIDGARRGETLSVAEFARLSDAVKSNGGVAVTVGARDDDDA